MGLDDCEMPPAGLRSQIASSLRNSNGGRGSGIISDDDFWARINQSPSLGVLSSKVFYEFT